MTGKHNTDISNYSTHIKSLLQADINPFEKLSLALVLLTEHIFGHHYLSDSLDLLYKEFFIDCFIDASDRLLAPILTIEVNKQRLTEIEAMVRTNRFATLVGVFSDFIEEQGFSNQTTLLRTLVTEGYILYANEDNQELHNLAVIYFKIGDIETAVNIAHSLTQKNAHEANYNFLLLDLYRHDKKYKPEFDLLKSKVLTTFNLSDEVRNDFEGIKMDNNS